jgi:hypothetical protein
MPVTFATMIDRWDLLNRKLKTEVQNLPELAVEQQQLEAIIDQARVLHAQQSEAVSKVREAVKLRQAMEKSGQDTHERITAVLKGKLGFDSNNLHSYGIQPRRPRKSKSKKSDTPASNPATPAEHGTPASQPTTPAGPAK